jgi:hypothetical protein
MTNYQVMMEWEKPYMEALVDTLSPFGDVLEVGFGMGYSASAIQKYNIKSHTIIENNPEVLKKLRVWAQDQKHDVIIIEDSWHNAIKSIGKFDCFFFDDSPNKDTFGDLDKYRFFIFYYNILKNNVKAGSRLSWFCGDTGYFIVHPDTDYFSSEFEVEIPDNSRYINDKIKNKQTMYLTLVKFKNGTAKEIVPVFLAEGFQLMKISQFDTNQ